MSLLNEDGFRTNLSMAGLSLLSQVHSCVVFCMDLFHETIKVKHITLNTDVATSVHTLHFSRCSYLD